MGITLTSAVKYPHLYLKEWPFQIVPSPSFYHVWAGRTEIRQRLVEMFKRVQQRKTSVIYLLWGYFGAGKTHSLRHFQWKLINNKEHPTFVGYHEFPASARRFIEVYQSFMSKINFQEVVRVAHLVFEDFRQKYGNNAIEIFNEKISYYNDDFTNAMVALANGKEKVIVHRWMRAEKVYLTDLRKVNIQRRVEGDESVFDLFSCLVRLLTYKCEELPTFRCVVWMIDDFHEIEKLKEDYRNAITRGLNSIFNNCPEHFCLVLAYTSRGISAIKGLLPEALIARLPLAPYVSIPPMSEKEARDFVIDLLRQFRPKGTTPPDDYYPFVLEAIDDIIDFTARKGILLPRSLMLSFDAVLDKAEKLIKDGKLKRINSNFAMKVLAKIEVL
jgi:hypothetical protein